MTNEKKPKRIYILMLTAMSVFAICFVSAMGFLNYRSTAVELEEQVILQREQDMVNNLETAIGFGKSFENYYGMEDTFSNFSQQVDGPAPFIIDINGELLYESTNATNYSERDIRSLLLSSEFSRDFSKLAEENGGMIRSSSLRSLFTPIRQNGGIIGYFGCIYTEHDFNDLMIPILKKIILLTAILALLEIIVQITYSLVINSEKWKSRSNKIFDSRKGKLMGILIIAAGIAIISAGSFFLYQKDYRNKIETATSSSLKSLESTIQRIRECGVELRDLHDLQDYISSRVMSLSALHVVRITEKIAEVKRTEEDTDLISFMFGNSEEGGLSLYLEAEISENAMHEQLMGLLVVLFSSMIILVIFVFELNRLVEIMTSGKTAYEDTGKVNEKKISLVLRLTGFLCSTAEYLCVPYAAMMIRESGESLFGLSVGMTAALPLTLEGLMQMIFMLAYPKFGKRISIKNTLILSGLLMILCNMTAFSIGGALVIVICRAIAGIAYVGFKQVSNYLITRGYETELGRSENISQDNAGLLAGATCGAGLGAILSSNMGYEYSFLFSVLIFAAYLVVTFFTVPWKALSLKKLQGQKEKKIRVKNVAKMLLSPEMLFFIIVIGIPLNIGVMLCATLVPAICQTRGISSVMLSYCYIANGIAGIYIGPALVTKAKKTFGVPIGIAFAFALTALSIFILRLPAVAVMLMITSMILGFLDGFATPLVTDQFMSLKVVRHAVDESTALIFSVVLSYVLLTFAPVIAELLLLPDNGVISPMLIGALVYMAAAVILTVFNLRKKKMKSGFCQSIRKSR